MGPDNIRFGGGANATVLHPLVAVAMVLAVILILCLPRKHVIIPALFALFLIPKGQQLVFAAIHLNVYRIIILAGLARWIISRRSSPFAGGFNFLDRLCTALFLFYFATNLFLYNFQTQALVKSTGDLLDALGAYIVIRFLIRDREDVVRTIKTFAGIAIINAACMLNEQRTGANIFGILGGVAPETVRDGKIRSQGSFEVFITAGTFGATLAPLLIWVWSQGKSKTISIVGLLGALAMSITCFASTTMVAFAAGIGALFLWPIRKYMRFVRWGLVAMLIALHFAMHGPIWSIIEHIDLTGSSSSYHRYMLIDNFVRHFSDWWLIGTKDNATWGWMMWDLSDQYVFYAFNGGLLAFVLFVTIISGAFSRIGTTRKLAEGNRSNEWFLWCLGAAVFSNVISFFGIDYMDQMQYAWFVLLAFISVAVFEVTGSAAPEVQEESLNYEVYDSQFLAHVGKQSLNREDGRVRVPAINKT